MKDLAPQISSKSEDSSHQARIPAPVISNIDTNHDANANELARAPPVSDQATLRLGWPGNHDFHSMTSEEKADAKKLAHAPPVYLESDQEANFRLGSQGNADLNPMTSEEKADAKKLAHAPPVHLESDQATLRSSTPGNAELNPVTHGEDAPNTAQLLPEPRASERANPGAFRIGGQDNDDGNTVTYGEEGRSHSTTTDVFQITACLVEEDPEEKIVVAVVAENEGGSKKLLIYIVIGIFVISVIVATVLGVTLPTRSSQSGTPSFPTSIPTSAPTSAPSSAPTVDPQRAEAMIALIQSRSSSTSFTDLSSPQSQALDWILADPYSSNGLSDDRLVQRFALTTLVYSVTSVFIQDPLKSINECDWYGGDFIECSPESVLERLTLIAAQFVGRIPVEVGLLTKLTYVELSYNKFTGSLPSELGLSTQLTTLDCDNNQFTGPLPSELGLLTNLRLVYLHDNALTGSVPSSLCSAGVNMYIDCGVIACTCCC